MSLKTLRADVRYKDANRALDSKHLDLNLSDPAFHRISERRIQIMDDIKALAAEHGWDSEAQVWS